MKMEKIETIHQKINFLDTHTEFSFHFESGVLKQIYFRYGPEERKMDGSVFIDLVNAYNKINESN
jgi:hypothetical protein